MTIIMPHGLRKHLEEKVCVGKNFLEVYDAKYGNETEGRTGILLEGRKGFYVYINDGINTNRTKTRAINDKDVILFLRTHRGYDINLSNYDAKNNRKGT